MQPGLIWLLLLLLDAGGTWAGLTADYNQVINLAFDRYYANRVFDDAPHHNNATLINGALIRKTEGSCGNCVELLGGNVELNGITFQGIPYVAITILMYVKLMKTESSLTLFETIGKPPRSNHMKPQYILQSENGRIFWFHRNENGTTVFSTFTDTPVLNPGKWSHVAVTYDGLRGLSQIYIDGKLNKEEKADPGVFLSRDWSKYVGIGEEGGQPNLQGYIDEFYIYNRSMLPIEIQSVIDLCQGEKASLVMHIGFDQKKDNVFVDDSGLSNDVTLSRPPVLPGKEPDPIPFTSGSCGGGVQINGPTNDLKLDGKTMRSKPVDAITIALWINVTSIKGIHYLFDTIGAHSQHIHDQYKLIMEEGVVTWSHHDEFDQKIFEVITDPVVTAVQWFHIVGTYSAQAKKAKVYINGNLNKEAPGSGGLLSQDWDNYAGFGSHPKGDMQAYDILDEIYMYSRELSPYEVKMLHQACNYGNAKQPVSSQVIYFGFDRVSGHTVFDDSGKENNGHLTNLATVTKTSGTCGNGLSLQGGDIMLVGNRILRKPLFGITFALWVKLNTNRDRQTIFMTTNPDSKELNKGLQYLFEIVNGTVTWFHKNEKTMTVFSIKTQVPVVPAGTWTHIAATFRTMGGKSQIFVNGEVKKEEWTGKGTLSQDWNGRVSIGKYYEMDKSGKWVGKNPLLGTIDELYIFDRALTPTELNLLGQTCNYKRVVLHFGFEVFDGQITYDQSGLANNGEVVNGTKADIGKCGKALNLTNGMIKLNGDFFKEKPQKAITISVWISLNTNRGYHEIFDTIGSRSFHKHDQYNFAVDTGRVIWYHHQEQDKEVFNIETMPVIPARIWTHIVVTYDASEMLAKVFINGKQVKMKSATGDLSQDWGHFAGIGYRFYRQDHLGGLIDEYIMYNYALSDEEIAFLAKGTCGR